MICTKWFVKSCHGGFSASRHFKGSLKGLCLVGGVPAHISRKTLATKAVGENEPARALLQSMSSHMSSVLGAAEAPKPFVTLTYAQSIDGSTSRRTTDRLMLSGSASAVMTHRLRAMHDAILVGVGTLLADDPQLTVRLVPGQNPLPVVVDSQLRTPHTSQLVTAAAKAPSGNGLVVITTEGGDSQKMERRKRLEALPGVHVRTISLSSAVGHRGVPLLEALAMLKQDFGSRSVMVEGGATVIGAFLADAQKLVDYLVVTLAPVFVGGYGPSAALGSEMQRRKQDMRLQLVDLKTCQLDADIVVSGRLQQQVLPQRHSNPLPLRSDVPGQVLGAPTFASECKMWVQQVRAECLMRVYSVGQPGQEIVALVKGVVDGGELVPLRVHSECFTGDILGSRRCDCGPQLHAFLRVLDQEPCGVLLYVRGHEGRGIGLSNKTMAYKLQEEGLDTVDANLKLGFDVDMRTFGPSLEVLKHLGIKSADLFSNNPDKAKALEPLVVKVSPLTTPVDERSRQYLETKRDRLNHRALLPEMSQVTTRNGIRKDAEL